MSDNNFDSSSQRPTINEERPTGYRFYEQEHFDPSRNYPPVINQQSPFQPPGQQFQTNAGAEDQKNLDYLALGYKVNAGITALFACFPFLHVFMGIMMLTGGMNDGRNPGPPAAFAWIFIIMGGTFILLGWLYAALNLYAGISLKRRQKYLFCFVMSCINCAFMPLGTILGVFSILLLIKLPIKELFNQSAGEI